MLQKLHKIYDLTKTLTLGDLAYCLVIVLLMTPSIQNIRPVFSGLLGAITQGNHQCSSSTAPCLSGHGDLVLKKHFQRHGKTAANNPVTWNYNGPYMTYTHIKTFTNTHRVLVFHSLVSSLSLRQLLLSNRIYKRWNNLCTHLPQMLGDIPAASAISYCSYWYAASRWSVLASKTTMYFSYASSLWTNRRTLASNHKTVWDMYI